jgi:NAD-dependent deacetylase
MINPPSPTESAPVQTAREILANAARVVAFSGAGLSADSGIATFRDTETDALWSRFDPMELASPDGFAANPQRVMDWYRWRRKKLSEARPNPAHVALAGQADLVHITQNVDDLAERAGANAENLLHLHGTIMRDHCHALCGYAERIELQNPPALRDCPECHSYLRPSVVWFGEGLSPAVWTAAETQCRDADCLLVIGTSATVFPAAALIEAVHNNGGSIIVVNTNPSDASRMATVELTGPAGDIVPALLDGLVLNRV